MDRSSRRSLLLALAAALALAGCRRVPPPDLSRDPRALAAQLSAAQAGFRSVRGTARVDVASPSLSGVVQELVAAEKPDRLRLETRDFFGNPAAVLVADGGKFAFLDAREGVLYRGDATPENVSQLLPVVLPVEELVIMLCGSAPLLPGEPVAAEAKDELVVLTISGGDTTQRVAVGAGHAVSWSRVRRAAPAAAASPEEAPAGYDLDFGEFRDSSGGRFPGVVVLDAPAARSRVALRWDEEIEVNAQLDPAVFRLQVPPGVRIVELARGQPVPRTDAPPRPPLAAPE